MMRATAAAFVLLTVACLNGAQPAPQFDGARAFEHLRQIVAIGPRPSGSPGAQKTRDYITTQLRALGIKVEEQAFTAPTPAAGVLEFVNLRATLAPSTSVGTGGPRQGRLIVAGHYDTKRFGDITFVGANDGGSSTAFLLELARALKGRTGAATIELLFLDGEEATRLDWEGDDNTYGSRHYVETARKAGTLKDIRALILVDMIADRDLRLKRESYSTPWLTEIIWSQARRLGRREFVEEETPILDDHVPFVNAGVPAVDLIDLEYPAWHTADDTLDKTSAASMQAVGDVLLAALPEIAKSVDR
jgi:Zn-dependent M28 family amino/carboxypeptidase